MLEVERATGSGQNGETALTLTNIRRQCLDNHER